MPVSTPIFFSNNYRGFQVSGGVLWHKWWAYGSTTNGNEDVVKASGLASGAITIPDQVPQGAVVNNQLGVLIQDSNLHAWFFAQSANAPWGARQLS